MRKKGKAILIGIILIVSSAALAGPLLNPTFEDLLTLRNNRRGKEQQEATQIMVEAILQLQEHVMDDEKVLRVQNAMIVWLEQNTVIKPDAKPFVYTPPSISTATSPVQPGEKKNQQ